MRIVTINLLTTDNIKGILSEDLLLNDLLFWLKLRKYPRPGVLFVVFFVRLLFFLSLTRQFTHVLLSVPSKSFAEAKLLTSQYNKIQSFPQKTC